MTMNSLSTIPSTSSSATNSVTSTNSNLYRNNPILPTISTTSTNSNNSNTSSNNSNSHNHKIQAHELSYRNEMSAFTSSGYIMNKEMKLRLRKQMGYCLTCEDTPILLMTIQKTKLNPLWVNRKPRTYDGECIDGKCLKCTTITTTSTSSSNSTTTNTTTTTAAVGNNSSSATTAAVTGPRHATTTASMQQSQLLLPYHRSVTPDPNRRRTMMDIVAVDDDPQQQQQASILNFTPGNSSNNSTSSTSYNTNNSNSHRNDTIGSTTTNVVTNHHYNSVHHPMIIQQQQQHRPTMISRFPSPYHHHQYCNSTRSLTSSISSCSITDDTQYHHHNHHHHHPTNQQQQQQNHMTNMSHSDEIGRSNSTSSSSSFTSESFCNYGTNSNTNNTSILHLLPSLGTSTTNVPVTVVSRSPEQQQQPASLRYHHHDSRLQQQQQQRSARSRFNDGTTTTINHRSNSDDSLLSSSNSMRYYHSGNNNDDNNSKQSISKSQQHRIVTPLRRGNGSVRNMDDSTNSFGNRSQKTIYEDYNLYTDDNDSRNVSPSNVSSNVVSNNSIYPTTTRPSSSSFRITPSSTTSLSGSTSSHGTNSSQIIDENQFQNTKSNSKCTSNGSNTLEYSSSIHTMLHEMKHAGKEIYTECLVSVMESNVSDIQVQMYCISTIHLEFMKQQQEEALEVSTTSDETSIIDIDVISKTIPDKILDVMLTHSSSVPIQDMGCDIILVIVSKLEDEEVDDDIDCGIRILTTLQEIIDIQFKVSSVIEKCFSILRILSTIKECRGCMKQLQLSKCIVMAMQYNVSCATIQQDGCALLSNMVINIDGENTRNETSSTVDDVTIDELSVIVEAMQVHNHNEFVMASACFALKNFAYNASNVKRMNRYNYITLSSVSNAGNRNVCHDSNTNTLLESLEEAAVQFDSLSISASQTCEKIYLSQAEDESLEIHANKMLLKSISTQSDDPDVMTTIIDSMQNYHWSCNHITECLKKLKALAFTSPPHMMKLLESISLNELRNIQSNFIYDDGIHNEINILLGLYGSSNE